MLRVALAVCLACLTTVAPAQEPKPPNVLFIISDDLNCDLGCYGHELVQSPHIDRLAARGVLFERAYCQYPVCGPSRSSLLTGVYPDQTGVLRNGVHFRDKLPEVMTLPQMFRENGYFVARVGKLYHYGVPLQIGTNGVDDAPSWEERVNPRGIDREVLDQVHTLIPGRYGGTLSWLNIESEDEDHTDGIGATEAIQLLESTHQDVPFFLAVGFYRPHTPFVAPSHYFDLYDREEMEPVMEIEADRDDIPAAALHDRPHQRALTLPQRQEIIQAYYASTSFMDAQVGRLLDALDRLSLTDNTIIVFVSDHGYHLGAHGLWQKQDLFEGSCRVPMVIVDPRNEKSAGQRAEGVVEMTDFFPTLAQLCGLAPPEHLLGESLVPVLEDPNESVREVAFTVGRGAVRGTKGYTIRTERYRYTEWNGGDQGVELYDYETDPIEFTNLAVLPEHAALIGRMATLLAEAKEKAGAE